MTARLECLSAPHVGKHLAITDDKPVVLKTNKGDQEAGEVRVELVDGSVVLTNRTRMICTVNDVQQARSVLHHEDRLTIGKQSFRVVVEDEADGEQTQFLSADEPEAEAEAAATDEPLACSVCDKVFDDLDRRQGWTSGDRHICRRCLSKGVRPGNLPDAGAATAPPPFEPVDIAPAPAPRAEDAEAEPSESDRQRRQRRLSASRMAQVEPAGKPGLLSKVGQVFSNREERKKLEALEQERHGLLEAAGRLALGERNGFSIPDHLVPPLIKGATVSLRPTDFSLPALERWRSLRGRLTFLDAEIAALRVALQMGPDPGVKLPEEPLRSDQVARQNHTFAMLDAMQTMNLDEETGPAVDLPEAEEQEFHVAPPARAPAPAPKPAAQAKPAPAKPVQAKPAAPPAKAAPLPVKGALQPKSSDRRVPPVSERRKSLRRRH